MNSFEITTTAAAWRLRRPHVASMRLYWAALAICAGGSAQAQLCSNCNVSTTTSASVQTQSQATSGGPTLSGPVSSTATANYQDPNNSAESGLASTSASADYGLLKAAANLNYANGGNSDTRANATGVSRYTDEVTVGGAGLAAGTPVTLTLEYWVQGRITVGTDPISGNPLGTGSVFGGASLTDPNGVTTAVNYSDNQQTSTNYTQSSSAQVRQLNAYVGETLTLSASLTAGAELRVGSDQPFGSASVSSDFSDTGYVSVVALSNPSVHVTGLGNGYDYSAPVPEPASLPLALAALALVGQRARGWGRRNGSRDRASGRH